MDQDSGNNTDKRNWREKLGIGKAVGTSELPKVAREFQPAPAVAPRTPPAGFQPAAKAVPMAPRIAPKPIAARPAAAPGVRPMPAPASLASPATSSAAAPRPAAVSPAPPRPAVPSRLPPVAADALAAKLKDQRDAAERLAVQRVAAAKQRTEPAPQGAGKPKFTFADQDAGTAAKAAAKASDPAAPSLRPSIQPAAGTGQPLYPQQSYQAAQQPNYAAPLPPGYRPIDPATGYAQQPQTYSPRPAVSAPPQMSPQQMPSQPLQSPLPLRPNNGMRPGAAGFQPQSFQPQAFQPQSFQPQGLAQQSFQARGVNPNGPRQPQMPMPQLPLPGNGPRLTTLAQDDVFENDAPPPRAQRRATANEYQQAYRDDMSDDLGQERPRAIGWIITAVILVLLVGLGGWGYLQLNKTGKTALSGQPPPAIEAPAVPAKVNVEPAVPAAVPADSAGKKQIYDRIEGDREVPAGPLKSTEQTPNLPVTTSPPPSQGGGAVPLPLPPPPAADGKQGSLSPDTKTDVAMITPAAEQSSAANSSLAAATEAAANPPAGSIPVPTGTEAVGVQPNAGPSLAPTPATASAKPIAGETPKKSAISASTKKLLKSVGATPLVLVPPSTSSAITPRTTSSLKRQAPPTAVASVDSGSGGLYGDAPTSPQAPSTLKATAAATPQPQISPAGYQVQLASFATKQEASAEYQRLSSKHGAIITRYAPLIETAQIAGSTRYRLNLGPMATNDVAQSVCASLISAGERDCLVHR